MFKQTSGFHAKNIIVESVCCENPDGKLMSSLEQKPNIVTKDEDKT